MSDFPLRFLTRPGCPLCDAARPLADWAAAKEKTALVEVDIEADDHLLGLYGLRIPVLLGPGDEVIAEGVIDDRRALRKRIRAARPGPSPK